MRVHTRKFILAAASMVAILLLCPTLRASNITLTGNLNFGYQGILVGPYAATLDTDPNSLLVFCLDLHLDTYAYRSYGGYLTTPSTEAEEEAAFLAAYSLHLGAPSASLVDTVQGPISMAIWQIMGTLDQNGKHTLPDPKAAPYVELARSAYASGQIAPAFLREVQIWTPASGVTSQRFITAVEDDGMPDDVVPEPGTRLFLGTGVILLAFSLVSRRWKSR